MDNFVIAIFDMFITVNQVYTIYLLPWTLSSPNGPFEFAILKSEI
jgi:hypothetical protein